MTSHLQEFRVLCESRKVLRKLWHNLVVCALEFREQKSKYVLRSRQEGTMLTVELVLLKKLEDNFMSAINELRDVCEQNNIFMTRFTLNEICDLYS